MSTIDIEWAKKELSEFLYATEEVPDSYDQDFDGATFVASYRTKSDRDAIIGQAHVVEKIFDRILREWPREIKNEFGWDRYRELALRCIAELNRHDEIAAKLGDDAPQMDVGQLHPWVWDAARPLWQSEHFSVAVQQAAVALNANLQTKVGRRDISETKLFQEVFSLDGPKEQKPRLRFGPNHGGDTYRSRLVGASALAQGLYSGVRNILSHESETEIAEQVALEQLAAFSLLARWVDEAYVETEARKVDSTG